MLTKSNFNFNVATIHQHMGATTLLRNNTVRFEANKARTLIGIIGGGHYLGK